MKFKISLELIETIKKNKFIRQKSIEFDEAIKNDRGNEYLRDNPDFVQVMSNLSKSPNIEMIQDDEQFC